MIATNSEVSPDSAGSESDNIGPLIFISAAEQSADRHAAALIRATQALRPGVRFVGVAGPQMREAGCHGIFDMTRHAGMLLGVLGAAGQAVRMFNTVARCLDRLRFDAAVVIDSPMLHIPLTQRLHARHIPVLYYIAPQLWAWGEHRLHKLRDVVERMAVILPFEETYFRERGLPATFVGHPTFEAAPTVNQDVVQRIRAEGSPVVALLPGSRRHVVEEVLPGQRDVARRIAAAFPGAAFGVSVANAQVAAVIDRLMARGGARCATYPRHHAELIAAADLVLVASGTTTLEVAAAGRPMIVMYNSSRLMYHLYARWVIRTRHLSLPNILAGRQIVPEFMPYYTSTAPIAQRAIALLQCEEERAQMSRDLLEATEPLRQGGASLRTAEMLLDLADERH